MTLSFERFAKAGLDLEDDHLGLLLNGGFSEIGAQMAREARRFDPSMSAAEHIAGHPKRMDGKRSASASGPRNAPHASNFCLQHALPVYG